MTAELEVHDAEVVQRADDVVEQRVTPPVRQRIVIEAQRAAHVAAYARQRAEVGRDVHVEPRIIRARAARERVVEGALRLVQLTQPPAHRRANVQRVAERTPVRARLGNRDGRLGTVGRSLVVGIHFVAARDPAQQRRGSGRRRRVRGCAARARTASAPPHGDRPVQCARLFGQARAPMPPRPQDRAAAGSAREPGRSRRTTRSPVARGKGGCFERAGRACRTRSATAPAHVTPRRRGGTAKVLIQF